VNFHQRTAKYFKSEVNFLSKQNHNPKYSILKIQLFNGFKLSIHSTTHQQHDALWYLDRKIYYRYPVHQIIRVEDKLTVVRSSTKNTNAHSCFTIASITFITDHCFNTHTYALFHCFTTNDYAYPCFAITSITSTEPPPEPTPKQTGRHENLCHHRL
jgi:hypothetical protein